MGVTLEEFWHLNPHKISVISDGYNEKIKQEMIITDRLNWMMGQYVLSALTVVMDGFSKSPKAKYIEKPMLSDEITDEEQEELEMKKETYVYADIKMNGIGSNSCGPLPLAEYTFDEKNFSGSIVIKPGRI